MKMWDFGRFNLQYWPNDWDFAWHGAISVAWFGRFRLSWGKFHWKP